jgi:signal transduction histidine kinase
MSLKTKLALAMSALFVLFVTVVAWVALHFFEREFTSTVTAQQYAMVSALADSIDEKLAIAQKSLLAASERLPPEAVVSPEEAQRFLDERVTLHATFDKAIFILDPKGRAIAASPYVPGRRGTDLSAREYYRRTVSAGKPYISNHFMSSHSPRHPVIVMTAPVFDRSGKLVAIMGGSLDLLGNNFIRRISDTKVGKGGYLYLIGDDRVLVAHPDRSRVMKIGAQPGVNRMLDLAIGGFEGSGTTVNSDGVEMLASFRHIRSNDWILAAQFPTAEAYAPLYKAKRYFIAVAAICTVAILLAAWLLAKRLTLPLQRMTAHVADLHRKSGGEKLLTVDSADEIGMLATAFNAMIGAEERQQQALKAAMAWVEDEKRRWEAIIAALGEGISIVDTDFRVIFQNQAHIEHIGDHRGEHCYEGFLNQPQRCEQCPVALAFEDGKVHTLEKTLSGDGITLSLAITASPLRDSTGAIVAGIELVRDMTERKRVEQEIIALNADLKQRATELTATNDELEAFSYSLSHDLRSPLTLIAGSADILLEDYGESLDENGKFYLSNIGKGSEKINDIIDAMLLLSQVTRAGISREEVDLTSFAAEDMLGLRQQEPERYVRFSVADGLIVTGDGKLLKAAVENLLANAWKYTAKTPNAEIEVGVCEAGDEKIYFVRDNGAGFSMEKAGKLFEPFIRLHRDDEFKGTGVGLAIVHRVITRHRGRVWAEAEPGKGATFFFTVPQA